MSDAVLTVLKFCLLALLYLFLLRVVLIVARELRGTPGRAAALGNNAAVAAPIADGAPARTKRQWRLIVVQPESERGHAFAIEGEGTLGRGGGCTVPLAFDTFVSQVHARVSERDGQLWIEDADSTNGTLVNSTRIENPIQLRRGDRVQVGDTVLQVDR
jgi:hypothetical protein